jgi:pyruvate dehydrogenase E2 component (dihydrolipoamide acetyltransferase)
MRHEVRLENLGDEKAAEATVSFWYFDAGEQVSEGQDLVEIVTDKATFNVTAPASGTLTEVVAGEGQAVKPGDLLGVMEAGE